MRRISILIILCLAVSVPLQAKPKKGGEPPQAQARFEDRGEAGHFSAAERHLIRSRLSQQGSQPGQSAHRELPPGLQKKLARGKPLPPGWQKKVQVGRSLDYQVYRQGRPLPGELINHLPPGPAGSEIIRVIDKIIRLQTGTRTVLDSFDLTPGY